MSAPPTEMRTKTEAREPEREARPTGEAQPEAATHVKSPPSPAVTEGKRGFLYDPRFQVACTWVWNLAGVLLTMLVVTWVLPNGTALTREELRDRPLLALIPITSEIISVGLLPILFMLLNKERPAVYGISKKELLQSIGFSTLAVIAYVALTSHKATSFNFIDPAGFGPGNPWNVLFALLAILAYGPLEVFFVVWLIDNTDRIFKSGERLVSAGVILTIVIYGLLQAVSQGLNILVIAAIFLALALVYRYTRNSVGPMLAWTAMNSYIWFLVVALLWRA